MEYDYKKRSHNKIFKRKRFIYKFCMTENKYKVERDFYLKAKCYGDVCCCCCSYIPKLYYYSDSRLLLIIENVGEQITPNYFKNNLDKIYPLYQKIYDDTGYYQNDMFSKNIVKKNDKLYIIDFELANKNHKILNKKGEKRNEFYEKFY